MKRESFRNTLKMVARTEQRLLLDYGKSDRADVDYHIITYCKRRLEFPKEIYQHSLDICASIARSIFELEVMVKWLAQDDSRYQAFLYSALAADCEIMVSMKKLRELEAKSERERLKISKQFETAINYSNSKLPKSKHSEVGHFKNLRKMASTVGNESRFIAYYDLCNKIAHPTPWLLTPSEDRKEKDKIIAELILATIESVEEICKTLR